MEMIKEAGVMFGEAAAGAILGPACEGVLESIKKCWMFTSPVLDRFKSTVEDLESLIPQMEGHNMKLPGRQDELKKLKEQMECGRKLLDQLSEVNVLSCFKASYNEKLDALDDSLKCLVRKLRLQVATDVKEVLVLEKENTKVVKKNTEVVKKNTRVVKRTKRKVDEVRETVKCGFFDLDDRMHSLEVKFLLRQVDPLNESADLAYALGELYDVAREGMALAGQAGSGYEYDGWFLPLYDRIVKQIRRIYGLVEEKTAENKAMVYIPVGAVTDFRMSIRDGVNLLRNCREETAWTDELKLGYTNKFIALEETLEALYNRLDGIRPLQWNCRKCDKSSGTTSTSIVDSAGFCR